MKNYETSEQLFIDIWEKYGSPSEIDDAETIYSFFTELVEKKQALYCTRPLFSYKF